MVSSLEALPNELLQRICLYLDWRTLSEFSLTNKHCHAAATFRLFETLCVNINDAKRLEAEVGNWCLILGRNRCFPHVRVLKIGDASTRVSVPGTLQRAQNILSQYQHYGIYHDAGELRTWSEEFVRQPVELSPHDDMKEDNAWQPLAQLIRRLPALSSIAYDCSDNIPQYVLNTLRSGRPQCRLELTRLNLERDIRLSDPTGPGMNPVSDLIPFLSSLSYKLSASDPTYSEEQSKLERILRDAPDLQEVRLWWTFPDEHRSPLHYMACTSQENEQTKRFRCASLKRLHLRIDTSIDKDHLEFWSHRTNFTRLEYLKLEGPIFKEAFKWHDVGSTFCSLKTLVFNIWYPTCNVRHSETLGRQDLLSSSMAQLEEFLEHLKPLSNLRISSDLSEGIILAIVDRHGPSLRHLWLDTHELALNFTLNFDLVNKLAGNCLLLQDLTLPLKRSKGDAIEVDIYKRLGDISTLRSLHVKFDVSRPYYETLKEYKDDDSYDDFHKEVYQYTPYHVSRLPDHLVYDWEPRIHTSKVAVLNGQVRDILINNAIDEVLAMSVFNKILEGSSHPRTSRLEKLILQPKINDSGYHQTWLRDLAAICDHVAQVIMCERDPRDTHYHEIKVRNLGPVRTGYYKLPSTFNNNSALGEIVYRLWPRDDDDKDSWLNGAWNPDSWHSHPLYPSSTVGELKSRI